VRAGGEAMKVAGEAVRWRNGFGSSLAAALAGARHAWRTQPNLRFEVVAAFAATAAAVALQTGLVAVLMASALVLVAELVNTAVEALVDLVSPERSHLAEVAKDTAAGAVLVAAAFAVAIGVVALGPAVWALLRSAVTP
jgi:diacylglycerol kinase (ATP)